MRLVLDTSPASVATARRAVREACQGRGVEVDDAVQCTSELAGNAVLHGAPPVVLQVDLTDRRLRVEVHDAGSGVVSRREPLRDDALSGRGLGIVEALATRFGTLRTPSGNVAWFELDVDRKTG